MSKRKEEAKTPEFTKRSPCKATKDSFSALCQEHYGLESFTTNSFPKSTSLLFNQPIFNYCSLYFKDITTFIVNTITQYCIISDSFSTKHERPMYLFLYEILKLFLIISRHEYHISFLGDSISDEQENEQEENEQEENEQEQDLSDQHAQTLASPVSNLSPLFVNLSSNEASSSTHQISPSNPSSTSSNPAHLSSNNVSPSSDHVVPDATIGSKLHHESNTKSTKQLVRSEFVVYRYIKPQFKLAHIVVEIKPDVFDQNGKTQLLSSMVLLHQYNIQQYSDNQANTAGIEFPWGILTDTRRWYIYKLVLENGKLVLQQFETYFTLFCYELPSIILDFINQSSATSTVPSNPLLTVFNHLTPSENDTDYVGLVNILIKLFTFQTNEPLNITRILKSYHYEFDECFKIAFSSKQSISTFQSQMAHKDKQMALKDKQIKQLQHKIDELSSQIASYVQQQ